MNTGISVSVATNGGIRIDLWGGRSHVRVPASNGIAVGLDEAGRKCGTSRTCGHPGPGHAECISVCVFLFQVTTSLTNGPDISWRKFNPHSFLPHPQQHSTTSFSRCSCLDSQKIYSRDDITYDVSPSQKASYPTKKKI